MPPSIWKGSTITAAGRPRPEDESERILLSRSIESKLPHGPDSKGRKEVPQSGMPAALRARAPPVAAKEPADIPWRSEERRVGKGCRSGWARWQAHERERRRARG